MKDEEMSYGDICDAADAIAEEHGDDAAARWMAEQEAKREDVVRDRLFEAVASACVLDDGFGDEPPDLSWSASDQAAFEAEGSPPPPTNEDPGAA